ncbi:MAG: hypothetical protein WA908_02130 [Pontixanthobacter sp.]
MISRDRELWGMALWVERKHGSDGLNHIHEKIESLKASGEHDGVELWIEVAMRYEQLLWPIGCLN